MKKNQRNHPPNLVGCFNPYKKYQLLVNQPPITNKILRGKDYCLTWYIPNIYHPTININQYCTKQSCLKPPNCLTGNAWHLPTQLVRAAMCQAPGPEKNWVKSSGCFRQWYRIPPVARPNFIHDFLGRNNLVVFNIFFPPKYVWWLVDRLPISSCHGTPPFRQKPWCVFFSWESHGQLAGRWPIEQSQQWSLPSVAPAT